MADISNINLTIVIYAAYTF